MHSLGAQLLLHHDQPCPLSLCSETRDLWTRQSNRKLTQALMQCGSPLHTRRRCRPALFLMAAQWSMSA